MIYHWKTMDVYINLVDHIVWLWITNYLNDKQWRRSTLSRHLFYYVNYSVDVYSNFLGDFCLYFFFVVDFRRAKTWIIRDQSLQDNEAWQVFFTKRWQSLNKPFFFKSKTVNSRNGSKNPKKWERIIFLTRIKEKRSINEGKQSINEEKKYKRREKVYKYFYAK